MFRFPKFGSKVESVELKTVDVDRAVEMFETDKEVVELCTKIDALIFWQSSDRATGDDVVLSTQLEDLTKLLASKGVVLSAEDSNPARTLAVTLSKIAT